MLFRSKNEKWRAQQVHIELRVPKGKIVYISKNMKNIINGVHNETDTWDGDMVGRRWIMGTEELKCLDCDGLDSNDKKKWKRNAEIEISTEEPIPIPPPIPKEPEMPLTKKKVKMSLQINDSIK